MDIFKDEQHGGYQVRTKNDAFFLVFDNPDKEKLFLRLVEVLKKANPAEPFSLSELKQRFSADFAEELVVDVLDNCAQQGLFVAHTVQEPFVRPEEVEPRFVYPAPPPASIEAVSFHNIPEKTVLVLSEHEALVAQLKHQLKSYPYKRVVYRKYADFPLEDTQQAIERFLDKEKIDFAIADGQVWAPAFLSALNAEALRRKLPWLFVNGIAAGYIKWGPLFYGKETGCWHCLQDRIKSQHAYPTFLHAYETFLVAQKRAATPDTFHYTSIYVPLLVQWIVLELFSFFELHFPIPSWRTLCVLNLQTYELKRHTLLKQPYCLACRPVLQYSLSPWLEEVAKSVQS